MIDLNEIMIGILIQCSHRMVMPQRIAKSAGEGLFCAFRSFDSQIVYADIEVFKDGAIAFVLSNGQGSIESWSIENTTEDIDEMIDKIKAHLRRN